MNMSNPFGPNTQTGNASQGKLDKAALVVYDEDKTSNLPDKVEFLYNPETVTVEKSAEFKEHSTQGSDAGEKEWTHSMSRSLKIASIYFDTFETRKNVRTEYIDKLERLIHYDEDLHRPPRLLFVWGKFAAENDDYNTCKWYLKKVNVNYIMFLNDGTPVRAKVDFELIEATSISDQQMRREKQSPDHAKIYTVRRGDTLQSIAFREYENPSEWRRIADLNGIDDPLNLEPGTKLLVPPILK